MFPLKIIKSQSGFAVEIDYGSDDSRTGGLFDNYRNGGIAQSLFMKLVEEIGEVAEVLNKKSGSKKSDGEDLQVQLGNELADVIHYAVAIAALNDLDINNIIIEKDKIASVKYSHRINCRITIHVLQLNK